MTRHSTGESVGRRWEQVAGRGGSAYRTTVVTRDELARLSRSPYVTAVAERTARSARCLETGCGSGRLSLALAMTGRRVAALDISKPVLANLTANRDRIAEQCPDARRVQCLRGDIEQMPFPDHAFDAVFSEGVIEHWTDKQARLAVIREMARVLAPGGSLVLFAPNGRHLFYRWWKLTRYPGYASENQVPWHRYASCELADELGEAGLLDVIHDGVSPWSTLAVWPNWLVLRALAALCRRLLPEPRWLRRRFGFNVMAAGFKPERATRERTI